MLGFAEFPRLWKMPLHLQYIDELLVDLAAGIGQRQLIFAPPRHGKSWLTSHLFPAWYLMTYPDRDVILTSYEADFAASWGRKVRDTMTKWGKLCGFSVRQDSKAADRWEIAEFGGGMRTAGARGAILGRGAHLFIVDDPVKNAEEALSETYRQKTWDWFNSTAASRFEPGACVVVTQQRWHTRDLGGMLATEQKDDWRVCDLKAIAEEGDVLGRMPGEALWPERFNAEELERKRRNSPMWFAAQYQQVPLDLEGGFFRGLERIKVVDATPTDFTKVVRAWDLAATEAQAGSDPDWTVGAKVGRHSDGTFWVCDVQRVRLGPRGVRNLIRQTAEADGSAVPIYIEREGGASGKIAAESIVSEDLAGFTARAVRPEGAKTERAEPWGSQIEAGNVCLVKGDWNRAMLDEHRGFPTGAHDDIVDACSLGFREVARQAQFIIV